MGGRERRKEVAPDKPDGQIDMQISVVHNKEEVFVKEEKVRGSVH